VTYSHAIFKFVLEFRRVKEQCKFWATFSHGPTLGAKCHRVSKMCSLTGTRNRILGLFRLSYPAAYTSSPLNSEQFWTVTNTYKIKRCNVLKLQHDKHFKYFKYTLIFYVVQDMYSSSSAI
jgi:hypothetical protein